MDTSNINEVTIASAVWDGLMSVGAIGLFILALVTIKGRKDPARSGFLWIKVALFCLSVGLPMNTSLSVVSILKRHDVIDRGTTYATYRINYIAWFFTQVADLSTNTGLMLIGLGFYRHWDMAPKVRKVLWWCVIGFTVITFLLAFSSMIGYQTIYRSSGWHFFSLEAMYAFQGMAIGNQCLQLIASITGLVLAAKIKKQSSERDELSRGTSLYLAAAILCWISFAWSVIDIIIYGFFFLIPSIATNMILNFVLSKLPLFLALVSFVILGRLDATEGVWSVQNEEAPKNEYGDVRSA